MNWNRPWLRRCLAVGLLALATLFPFSTLSAPDWSACVVDESNQPISGILVRENYQNYSAEFQGHEEDQHSDSRGCVHFAPKKTSASLLKRLVVIGHSALGGVHASFGSYAYVTAFQGSAWAGDEWQRSSRHMDSSLVLRSQ